MYILLFTVFLVGHAIHDILDCKLNIHITTKTKRHIEDILKRTRI